MVDGRTCHEFTSSPNSELGMLEKGIKMAKMAMATCVSYEDQGLMSLC
jgi:hypothetical protein